MRRYLENEGKDFDASGFANIRLSFFDEAIETYKQQGNTFQGIPINADVGIMHVDSSDLKMRLLPSPEKCMTFVAFRAMGWACHASPSLQ